MCHICAKGFLDSNCTLAVINKISFFFLWNCPNFTYSQKLIFVVVVVVVVVSIIEKRLTNCFYLINFMAGTCKESTLFIFASCEPLISRSSFPCISFMYCSMITIKRHVKLCPFFVTLLSACGIWTNRYVLFWLFKCISRLCIKNQTK